MKTANKQEKIFKVSNKNGRGEIILYAEIGGWFGLSSSEFIQEINNLGNVSHVDLRISSEGGSVIEAIDMFNAIRRHPATWHAHIDGLAASAASWLPIAAKKIYMAENAQMMIHRASAPAFGTAEDLRKTADLIESIEQTALVNAYKAKTGLDDKTIMDMLDAETWMTADRAKELGFVDEISETLQMAASLKLSGRYAYNHAPKELIDQAGQENSELVGTPLLQAAKMREMEMKAANR